MASVAANRPAPAFVSRTRPAVDHGIQIGDVTRERAIVWSRTDREARMFVEWDTTPRLASARRVRGPDTTAELDYTARVDLEGLPSDEDIFLRVTFEDPTS